MSAGARLNTRGRVSYRIEPVTLFRRNAGPDTTIYHVAILVDGRRVEHFWTRSHSAARNAMGIRVRWHQAQIGESSNG